MAENLNIGLQLLLVGMISVFIILGFVVAIGHLLITIINKWYAEDSNQHGGNRPDKKKIAVLSAVVQTVTEGKGVISSVNKI